MHTCALLLGFFSLICFLPCFPQDTQSLKTQAHLHASSIPMWDTTIGILQSCTLFIGYPLKNTKQTGIHNLPTNKSKASLHRTSSEESGTWLLTNRLYFERRFLRLERAVPGEWCSPRKHRRQGFPPDWLYLDSKHKMTSWVRDRYAPPSVVTWRLLRPCHVHNLEPSYKARSAVNYKDECHLTLQYLTRNHPVQNVGSGIWHIP